IPRDTPTETTPGDRGTPPSPCPQARLPPRRPAARRGRAAGTRAAWRTRWCSRPACRPGTARGPPARAGGPPRDRSPAERGCVREVGQRGILRRRIELEVRQTAVEVV